MFAVTNTLAYWAAVSATERKSLWKIRPGFNKIWCSLPSFSQLWKNLFLQIWKNKSPQNMTICVRLSIPRILTFLNLSKKCFEIWQFPDSEWVGLTFFLKTAFIQTVRKIDKILIFKILLKFFARVCCGYEPLTTRAPASCATPMLS
jgi:hypothetical protein